MMAAQVSLVPGLGQGSGVPWHSSTFHLQPTEAQSELFAYVPHVEDIPVQIPPDVPPPLVAPPTPPEPTSVVTPPSPPVPPGSWPPVPPSPPPSAGAHTHAVNVPAPLHVWSPCCPVGHAHSTLAPGTHLGASPPPPQAPSNAKGMNEARILGALPMAGIVARFRVFCNTDPRYRSSSVSPATQSSIGSTPSRLSRARLSFMALSTSGGCPCQSVTSPATRTGSRERYDFVGLPGYLLSVRLGSSSIGPVGSTR